MINIYIRGVGLSSTNFTIVKNKLSTGADSSKIPIDLCHITIYLATTMRSMPIKKLAEKVGKARLALMLKVDLSTIYLWLQRESDVTRQKGRRPGLTTSRDLVAIAQREGIEQLTYDYLAGL